jgi:hypothetical protein
MRKTRTEKVANRPSVCEKCGEKVQAGLDVVRFDQDFGAWIHRDCEQTETKLADSRVKSIDTTLRALAIKKPTASIPPNIPCRCDECRNVHGNHHGGDWDQRWYWEMP